MAAHTSNRISGEHQWLERKEPHLKLESGEGVVHYQCGSCDRDIVTVLSSGAVYAVYTSAVYFCRLDDEVTARWLSERCPGKRLPSDDDDRKKLLSPPRLRSRNAA